MKDPLDIIRRTRTRLVRLAMTESMLFSLLPLIVTVAAALCLDVLNNLALDHLGYFIEPARLERLRDSFLVLGAVELLGAVLLALRSRINANNFVHTAELIDQSVRGRQEIVTLAALSDVAKEPPSPFYPVLRRRVVSYLEKFDPQREFKLNLGETFSRSSVLAAGAAFILMAAIIALMTVPTPAQAVAHRLRQLAGSMDVSGSGPTAQQLAAAARDVAKDLENPNLPPEQKEAELQALNQQLDKIQPPQASAQSGKGTSSGSNGNGSGGGKGSGSGEGAGNGAGKSGTGTGIGAGAGGKGNQQMLELRNDIAKAQTQLEQQAASGEKTTTAQNNSAKGNAPVPQPGKNPNASSGQNKPNGTGTIQLPQPGRLASNQTPSGQNPDSHRSDKGSMGDTHLGEFPKTGNYERYYKLGEGGQALHIRDARYVTFQLPTEIAAAAAGSLAPDQARPRATTPYTNAPLKQQQMPASPDEQQLVPPRYRDLIR